MKASDITAQHFQDELRSIVAKHTSLEILDIPGVYEEVSEHFNNTVIDNLVDEGYLDNLSLDNLAEMLETVRQIAADKPAPDVYEQFILIEQFLLNQLTTNNQIFVSMLNNKNVARMSFYVEKVIEHLDMDEMTIIINLTMVRDLLDDQYPS